MSDELMLGILLIIVGIAVGLIAVALVLNRREDRIAAELGLEDEGTENEEPHDGEEESEEEEEADLETEEPREEAPEDEEPEESTLKERRLIAEVYREDVSGSLIIRAGGHEYTDAKQIEDEGERRRLAYAASDLADWFQEEFEPRSPTAPTSSQQPSSPDRMLEEINEILQRSLAGTPDRGVRLYPDAVGGVKVFIGVKSYEIEEVPDDEIRGLIRQAVAEWEGRQ